MTIFHDLCFFVLIFWFLKTYTREQSVYISLYGLLFGNELL